MRRLSVLLPRVPARWAGGEPTCRVPGRAAAALLRAPAEPPARGPGRPGPPGIRVRSPGSARRTFGEWPAFRWGLCCRFLFAFSETVCFVFPFPPPAARFGASPMGEPAGSCLRSPRSRRGPGGSAQGVGVRTQRPGHGRDFGQIRSPARHGHPGLTRRRTGKSTFFFSLLNHLFFFPLTNVMGQTEGEPLPQCVDRGGGSVDPGAALPWDPLLFPGELPVPQDVAGEW